MTDNTLTQYMQDVKRHPLLTANQERLLAQKIHAGDLAAEKKLVESNLRLVVKMAKQYAPSEDILMDLIQEGNIALMSAAKKFSYKHETKFSTYAVWWIRQALQRYFLCKHRAIRLPARKERILRQVEQVSTETSYWDTSSTDSMEHGGGRQVPVATLKQLRPFAGGTISLDAPLKSNEGSVLYDSVADTRFDPLTAVLKREEELALKSMLNTLSAREKDIVQRRFGFYSGSRPEPLKRIAADYSLSAESVRQITLKAIRKLQETHSLRTSHA